MKLKPVSKQNILLTGATSGIGLTTARMAAKRGASLGLIARNDRALETLAEELLSTGCRVFTAAADVGDRQQFDDAAERIAAHLGSIDTWVNNAGVTIYGRLAELPLDEMRKLFDTNVWGVVNGSQLAVKHMRAGGGALINIGSELSEAPLPLQGIYTASKHAVKGFTDCLRIEVEADGLPISVTLVQPSAIHTPYVQNGRNHLPYEPSPPWPLYAPELVAEAILHCAENRVPRFYVGESSRLDSTLSHLAPGGVAKFHEAMIDRLQNSHRPPAPHRRDGLFAPNLELQQRGEDKDRSAIERSPYQAAMLHPTLTKGLLLGGGLALAALFAMRKGRDHQQPGF